MLLDCDSLLSLTTTWSQPFSRYFVDHVHPSIDRLGAWLLRPYGMESATTNQSEAFNFVLKRLQEWREAPIDAMALSLFRLSQFHYAEIQRGRCGQGDFCLRPGVSAVHSDVVPALRSRPDDIVARIRGASTEPQTGNATAETEPSSPSPQLVDVEPDDEQDFQATSPADTGAEAPASDVAAAGETSVLTSAERAAVIIDNQQIALNPKLAVFTINGTSEPRVVRLFPSVTCSCPATSDCYHVMAARLAIGISSASTKRTINLSQLRKNKRKRADKTSGRKRPRNNDVEVIPADDHDDDETAEIVAAINANATVADTPADAAASPSSPSPSSPVRQDICYVCNAAEPPAGRCRGKRILRWVGCDTCSRWYHMSCVQLRKLPANYICELCG